MTMSSLNKILLNPTKQPSKMNIAINSNERIILIKSLDGNIARHQKRVSNTWEEINSKFYHHKFKGNIIADLKSTFRVEFELNFSKK